MADLLLQWQRLNYEFQGFRSKVTWRESTVGSVLLLMLFPPFSFEMGKYRADSLSFLLQKYKGEDGSPFRWCAGFCYSREALLLAEAARCFAAARISGLASNPDFSCSISMAPGLRKAQNFLEPQSLYVCQTTAMVVLACSVDDLPLHGSTDTNRMFRRNLLFFWTF